MRVTTDKSKTREENKMTAQDVVRRMCLMDDDFMSVVFRNKDCVQLLLDIILAEKNLKVMSCKTQYVVPNLFSRSSRLDIYAVDSKGKQYDIEVQNIVEEEEIKGRIRLYSALMDANALNKSEKTDMMPETYIIFILNSDIFEGKYPICNIDRIIRESKKPYYDGLHITLVNSQNKDSTPLGMLMQDFYCVKPDEMHYEILSKEAKYYKYGEGEFELCKLVEDYCEQKVEEERRKKEEAIRRAEEAEKEKEEAEQAKKEEKQRSFLHTVEIARALLSKGILNAEEIADMTKLTLEQVENIANEGV